MIKKFLKSNLKDKKYFFLKFIQKRGLNYQKRYNFSAKYNFINRQKGQNKLLLIVAGYKDYLWEQVFARIILFLDRDIDVCILSPGKKCEKLEKIARENSWSYLSLKENKLSVAQNIAINLHKRAQFIFKLDEDIFIGKNYFKSIFSLYQKISKEKKFKINFIAPVLNVNGISYLNLLEMGGGTKEYRKKFGEENIGIYNQAWKSPEAAKFLWEQSLPLDEKIKEFGLLKEDFQIIPFRFSIGAIFLERSWWEEFGGFKAAPEGMLGIEEEDLIVRGVVNGRVALLSTRTFAGHFSFGTQTEKMKTFFKKNKEKFLIKK